MTGPPMPATLLPSPVALDATSGLKSPTAGAWLVNYCPVSADSGSQIIEFDGTIRIEAISNGRRASGDLYQRPVARLPGYSQPVPVPAPCPTDGIPILPRALYRYYLRVTRISEPATPSEPLGLGLQMWRFDKDRNTWTNEGDLSADMRWIPAPPGYPSTGDYLEGSLKDGDNIRGRLKMGWISKCYRKAVLEIDTVKGSDRPLDSGIGHNWSTVFGELGWDVNVILSDTDVSEPSGDSWSNAEMHAAMLQWRDKHDLDNEWRFHILAVKAIDETPRGIMYDAYATDSNNIPREGVGIASEWIIPTTGSIDWGLVKGMRFASAKTAYFRTAVHELGHAFGIYHNTLDLGFMNTSDTIARRARPSLPFPNNIKWSFEAGDVKRLLHYPDLFVRPGGTPFGSANETTPAITPMDMQYESSKVRLDVEPLLDVVPLGAPVRITARLTNISSTPTKVPANLNLKSGLVRGTVKCGSGAARPFTPLILCVDDYPMVDLQPGESVSSSLTLLRGGEGALFPSSGLSEISVTSSWNISNDGAETVVSGSTTILVTDPKTPSHAKAALRILQTPDVHLVLVFGGDHLEEGRKALEVALADETLRPHYAFVKARCIAQPFMDRGADIAAAQELIKGEAVMSPCEESKINRLIQAANQAAA